MDATMTVMTSSFGTESLGGVAQVGFSKMLRPECYTHEKWFERELKTIHFPAWHFACLSSSIPDTGSFVTRRFLGRSVIVVRSEDGDIRAFLNTCRHRAAPLTSQRCGQGTHFKCPFHEWTYDTSGKLTQAPGLGGYVTKSDLPGLNLNLVPVQCEVAAGLVFVNLNDDNETPLEAYLGNYINNVAVPHQTQRMRCVHEKAYTLTTNWKLYIEVDMETLHTNFIHSRSIGSQPVKPVQHDRNWFGVYHKNLLSPALFPEKRNLAFVGYAFHEETLARNDFNEVAQFYYERLDQVIFEDDQICEYQQGGLSNGVQGHYTPVEPVAAYFSELIGARLREAGYE